MGEIAARLTDEAMQEVAIFFERLPPRMSDAQGDAAAITRGLTIATKGIPARDIPACIECHGPTVLPKNPAYPTLAAQHARYLMSQLMLLQERRRGGTPNVDLMHVFVNRLRHEEIRDAAHYYSALGVATSP
jgi:cytochrome c553